MKYQPKRSRAKFSEGAPYWTPDMGRKVQFLGMSGAPTHPQGFSQWGELNAFDRSGCGKHIRWLDLPENIRAHVIMRAADA